MPVVTILGTPYHASDRTLERLVGAIEKAVARPRKMKIKPDWVSVCIPRDRVIRRKRQEVIAFVDMFAFRERTKAVKEVVASLVAQELHAAFPDAKIEVFVRTFNQKKEGFCVIEPKE